MESARADAASVRIITGELIVSTPLLLHNSAVVAATAAEIEIVEEGAQKIVVET